MPSKLSILKPHQSAQSAAQVPEAASLSAILLDDEYYNFMLAGKKIVDGVSLLDEYHLIPLKAKAWGELTQRRMNGESGLSKHVKKHRNDIVQIFSIVDPNRKISLHGRVRRDMEIFLAALKNEDIDFKSLGLGSLDLAFVCKQLDAIYLS